MKKYLKNEKIKYYPTIYTDNTKNRDKYYFPIRKLLKVFLLFFLFELKLNTTTDKIYGRLNLYTKSRV